MAAHIPLSCAEESVSLDFFIERMNVRQEMLSLVRSTVSYTQIQECVFSQAYVHCIFLASGDVRGTYVASKIKQKLKTPGLETIPLFLF